MIDMRGIEFTYGDSYRLVVDKMSIDQGERVAWLGPSGSGKTTLLQLVAGILEPVRGSVEACGTNMTQLTPSLRRDFRISRIGLVFQEFELVDYLDVLDNVLLAFRISRTLKLNEEVRERAKQLIVNVGLEDLMRRRPDQLSHGQRQRIAICRALVTNPALVLADEPTANLDDKNKHRSLDLLDDFVRRSGATLVVVTHDHEVTARFERVMEIGCDSSGQYGVTEHPGHSMVDVDG